MIDVTDRVLAGLDAAKAAAARTAGPHVCIAASEDPKAAATFAKLAAYRSREIANKPSGFDDFDEALNFQALAACLSYYVDHSVEQSAEEPLRPDPHLAQLYRLKLMDVLNVHQMACIKNRLWRIYYDVERDKFHACLTRRRRRSALLALNSLAQADLLDHVCGRRLSSGSFSDDEVYFAFASSAEHLRFVEESTPESWSAFTSATGFSAGELTKYVGFLAFLGFAAQAVGHRLFYSEEFLLALRNLFTDAFGCAEFSDEVMLRLMDLFSLTPEAAAEYSLPVPFFRIGNHYLRYDGFLNIMSPAMGLLTIVIRKHESVWSRTLGSTLAHAADVVAASLRRYPGVEVAVRRKFKGKGDVDLALYDVAHRHLLICEVKTVYDKHRTVYQMHRFEEAKVNVERAVDQLQRAVAAIRFGDLSMTTLFGHSLPGPVRSDKVLLSWLDPIDLTMDTSHEDVLSLNFASFRYVYNRCDGDVSAMVRSINELRNIWYVAMRRPLDLGQPDLKSDLEVQIPALDPDKDLAALNLSTITLEELRRFPSIGWDSQDLPEEAGESVTYVDQTRQFLSKMLELRA